MANGIKPSDGRYNLKSDQTYGNPPKKYDMTLTITGSTAAALVGPFTYIDPPGVFEHDTMDLAIKVVSWDPVAKTGDFVAIVGPAHTGASYTGTISAAP